MSTFARASVRVGASGNTAHQERYCRWTLWYYRFTEWYYRKALRYYCSLEQYYRTPQKLEHLATFKMQRHG